jgi:lysyl-tRNA synthetase class II
MGLRPIFFCFHLCQPTFVIVFAVKFDPLAVNRKSYG